MISNFFTNAVYNPLYNGLVFLINTVPYADVGIAVILLTIFVKFILFPLSIKAVRTQLSMRKLEPELKKIKEKHKKDQQELARQTMALYKENGVNPFSSILLIFIQIPIIFGLYWVFFKGGLPVINTDILYSFVKEPSLVNMNFLGLVEVSERSAILAIFAGITQYFQIKLSLPPMKERPDKPSIKDDLARSFNIQMRYVMPFIVFFVSYAISAAIALYWTTSNLFSIGQEIFVRRNIREKFNNE